jgi:hypothetical protein
MDRRRFLAVAASPALYPLRGRAQARKTEVTIRDDAFYINGRPTYAGRLFKGKRVEGLLMNIRAVQGIFDDLNPETAPRWVYPDTKRWDPDRNTREFVAAMPEWKRHGVLAFTINLQGGSPGFAGGRGRRGGAAGTATPAPGAVPAPGAAPAAGGAGAPATAPAGNAAQPPAPASAAERGGTPGAANPAAGEGRGRGPAGPQLENSAIDPEGNLRPAYMTRLQRILDRADELGMVAIVGYFYFGQDQRLKDEAAVSRAVLNATNWILDAGYRNVLVEVNNECNISYDHEILQPARVPELIKLVQSQTRSGRRLMVSTSFGGTTSRGPRDHPDTPVTAAVARQSDYLLIHGNGPNDPALIKRCISATRELGGRPVPVMINEDPNFHFTQPTNHLLTSVDEYTSWGYYEQGQNNYQDGFQSPPVNWTINTDNKRQFFELVKNVTGV